MESILKITDSQLSIAGQIKDICTMHGVAALMVTPAGEYLMQLRDDLPHVMMRNYWGLFGGWTKPGESSRQAMMRELLEELDFSPIDIHWFTETTYLVPGVDLPPLHKTFFEVPITHDDVQKMIQSEGAAKKLYTASELRLIENTIPWDSLAVFCHDRRDEISRLHGGEYGTD